MPPELAAVVAKMMAKDPSDRFQTPGEVARALSPYFKSRTKELRTPIVTPALIDTPIVGSQAATQDRSKPQEAAARPLVSEPGTRAVASTHFPDLKLDLDAEHRSQPTADPQRPSSTAFRPSQWWAIAAVDLLLLGIMLYVTTENGSIKIELDDPKVVVKIDGQAAPVENLDEPIAIPAGQHKMVILRTDGQIQSESFTVSRGKNPRLS